MCSLVDEVRQELASNDNKISVDFIAKLYDKSTKTYSRVTKNTAVVVITLPSGHELLGYSQVLDANNFDESIGLKVASDNAKDKLWKLIGTIAKCYM